MKSLLAATCLFSPSVYSQNQGEDLTYKIQEDFYLAFPSEKHDFENWQSVGSALLHKNKAVVVPQSTNSKGLIYNVNAYEKTNWMIDMEFQLENEVKTNRGGAGFGIFYLSEIDISKYKDTVFGYSNIYDGLSVLFNSVLRSTDPQLNKAANMIQGIKNEGKEVANPFQEKGNSCYKVFRNLEDPTQYAKVRIVYEEQLVTVKYANIKTGTWETCFSMPVDLDFQGYFLISGGSGYTIPDSVFIKSFVVSDPKEVSLNEHFQQARAKKASFENLAGERAKGAHDLLHEGSDFGGRPATSTLLKKIPLQETAFKIKANEVQDDINQAFGSFAEMLHQQPSKHMFEEMEVFNLKLLDQLEESEHKVLVNADEIEDLSKKMQRAGIKGGGKRKNQEDEVTHETVELKTKEVQNLLKDLDKATQLVMKTQMLYQELEQMTHSIEQEKETQIQKVKQANKRMAYKGESQMFISKENMEQIHESYFPPDQVGSMTFVEQLLVFALGGTFFVLVGIWYRLNSIENKYGK